MVGGGGGRGGGHPDPEIRGGPVSNFFLVLRASVRSKSKGAGPLDPPLLTNEMDRNVRHLKRSWEQSLLLPP